MIIKKSFFTHWKTRTLVRLNGGDRSILIDLQELWAHCEESKAWEFENMDAQILAAMANTSMDPEQFEAILLESRFIYRVDNRLIFNDWEEHNSGLVANWENGKKGGRPKKPNSNPTKPMGNPSETQAKPNGTQAKPCSVVKCSSVKSSGNTNCASANATAPDPFEDFWQAFNFKKDKAKARLAWNKAIKAGADPDEIIAGAKRYDEEMKLPGAGSRKWAQGWLSGERWHDEPEPESERQKRMTKQEKEDAIHTEDSEFGF